ncbi:hypothetical protein AB0D49_20645 [Streptomyces sp. NPDC048290]|uniref:hypothetical protein n=1 Tax=Streptomyces sp. NPDC048290 TaxID=3155811 RepID=UPI00341F4322
MVLAVRDLGKGEDAAARITARTPGAALSLQRLDLSDLASVRTAARELRERHERVDLLITYELQRRLADRHTTVALAAHPGGASTELTRDTFPPLRLLIDRLVLPLAAQSAEMGALPSLRAATDPHASGGQYYGPDRVLGMRGHPRVTRSNGKSYDTGLQRRLWSVSERLTGVVYPV